MYSHHHTLIDVASLSYLRQLPCINMDACMCDISSLYRRTFLQSKQHVDISDITLHSWPCQSAAPDGHLDLRDISKDLGEEIVVCTAIVQATVLQTISGFTVEFRVALGGVSISHGHQGPLHSNRVVHAGANSDTPVIYVAPCTPVDSKLSIPASLPNCSIR